MWADIMCIQCVKMIYQVIALTEEKNTVTCAFEILIAYIPVGWQHKVCVWYLPMHNDMNSNWINFKNGN